MLTVEVGYLEVSVIETLPLNHHVRARSLKVTSHALLGIRLVEPDLGEDAVPTICHRAEKVWIGRIWPVWVNRAARGLLVEVYESVGGKFIGTSGLARAA
jgi:hypothetical protein